MCLLYVANIELLTNRCVFLHCDTVLIEPLLLL